MSGSHNGLPQEIHPPPVAPKAQIIPSLIRETTHSCCQANLSQKGLNVFEVTFEHNVSEEEKRNAHLVEHVIKWRKPNDRP